MLLRLTLFHPGASQPSSPPSLTLILLRCYSPSCSSFLSAAKRKEQVKAATAKGIETSKETESGKGSGRHSSPYHCRQQAAPPRPTKTRHLRRSRYLRREVMIRHWVGHGWVGGDGGGRGGVGFRLRRWARGGEGSALAPWHRRCFCRCCGCQSPEICYVFVAFLPVAWVAGGGLWGIHAGRTSSNGIQYTE